MRLLQEHHLVQGWAPIDINGGAKASDIVSLKNYGHVTVLLIFGNTTVGGDVDIALNACDDVAGTHTAALNNYKFRKMATGADDWADEVSITDSKIDFVAAGDIIPNTDDDCIVAVELDAEQIKGASSTYVMDCLRVDFPDPGGACVVGCVFILSEPRYAMETMPSAIID